MKGLSKEDYELIIDAINYLVERLEQWPEFEDGENINAEYVKELNDLLERL